ncbi:hypothetical protein [Pararobbsia alpina]|uniref:MafI family immunity protein n=1 Tax=Pararobbsia alpina TaxID=621374 RepID=A0A6S7D247_9BURK|nr:hypothetical protein [Pararobbsia alpina]CAB3794052.1 hypothetical protein LMG28138_03645 [Pararobbsia alpina]
MKIDQSHFDGIEQLLREVLNLLGGKISGRDRTDVVDYLDHGEYGIAYELLTFVLDNQQITRPPLLREAGKKMGMTD